MDPRPIGVFDSGVGGLTVVKQLMSLLPEERIIYFGDTARIPYGTKSEETIVRFALENSVFLLEKQVKIIVVACNTASAIALDRLQQVFSLPVVGVIAPGAQAALEQTRNGRIGVIGTASTIRSNAYVKALKALDARVKIFTRPCPLFVPLVEEGWIEDEATYLIARRYLRPLMDNGIDTLILGCTHYPLLKSVLQQVLGESVVLIDSGIETARHVEGILKERGLRAPVGQKPEHYFYLSDLPYKFQEIGERFLERSLPHVETVNFEAFVSGKGRSFWERFERVVESTPVK
ncbi:MAG: glutamate racemase [Calditrichaeota bacterium]|nr:glutamate racemase [Calditrichota bacterium]